MENFENLAQAWYCHESSTHLPSRCFQKCILKFNVLQPDSIIRMFFPHMIRNLSIAHLKAAFLCLAMEHFQRSGRSISRVFLDLPLSELEPIQSHRVAHVQLDWNLIVSVRWLDYCSESWFDCQKACTAILKLWNSCSPWKRNNQSHSVGNIHSKSLNWLKSNIFFTS